MRGRWLVARVTGPSMVPTLRHGDLVLARRRARVRVGDVVLARYRSMPDRLVVKRVLRREADGWWLASDNPFAGGSSETNGVADVVATARVLLRRGKWPARVPPPNAVSPPEP